MKLLYIIGNGSLSNNEELCYSLRTVERHLKDVSEIVVVGERIDLLSDKVKHFYIEEAKGNKEYRIAMKIMTACEKGYISGDFALMNDDFFFTRQFDWSKNYAKPELTSNGSLYYRRALNNTRQYLSRFGLSTYHFDVHTPILYNSEKFKALKPHFEQSGTLPDGMVVKSLYANIYGLKPTFYDDCKITRLQTLADFEKIETPPVISCTNNGWNRGIRDYFKKQYPNKSIYEK